MYMKLRELETWVDGFASATTDMAQKVDYAKMR